MQLLRFFTVVVLTLLLFGGCRRTEDRSLPFTVMTFNIRYGTAPDGEHHWHLRQELVYSLLKKEAPDIVGLQEALNFQIDAVLTQLPDYRRLGEYSAILYRPRFRVLESETFWFSDTPEVAGSKSWGNTITRICTWARFADDSTGKNFYVYNLHLDHQSQPSREKSVELLLQKINTRAFEEPVVVMGDFNAGEQNRALLELSAFTDKAGRRFFVNAFRAVHPHDKAVGTFHGFSDQAGAEMIDHIFVTRNIDVRRADIVRDHPPGRYPSDHYPVIAELQFNRHTEKGAKP